MCSALKVVRHWVWRLQKPTGIICHLLFPKTRHPSKANMAVSGDDGYGKVLTDGCLFQKEFSILSKHDFGNDSGRPACLSPLCSII